MSIKVDVIAIKNTLDNRKGNELLELIKSLEGTDAETIVLDFKLVKFIDSAGLGALVKILKTSEGYGKRLILCSVQSQVSMLLNLTRMTNIFEIHSDQAAVCNLLNQEMQIEDAVRLSDFQVTEF